MTHIRRFKTGDEQAIYQLFHDTVHHINAKDYTPEQVATWAPKNTDLQRWSTSLEQNHTFVAVDTQHQIVGFADLTPNGYLDRGYVHKNHQGQLIGKALFQAIEKQAKKLGLRTIFSDVSITAKPFLEFAGFYTVKRQQKTINGVHFTNFLMHKLIAQNPQQQTCFDILNQLKNKVIRLLGFHEDTPRINYGPCGVFAHLFFHAWNIRFSEKVHICFVLTKNKEECDHIVIRLPSGELYDGGIGVHDDALYTEKFIVEDMRIYHHATLDKWSYGLDRTYPRYCPNFDKAVISNLIDRYLNKLSC
ncbi:MAG: GNAT family N-acetyltransferase [Gammaproteobacteria bacterium]|nr:GNAT family N-acetyltransferase [Gammaproteobacteria bacterium]